MKTFKKEEVVNTIGNFIEKYHNDPSRVELPQCGFAIESISDVKIDKESLKEFGEIWSFEGTAVVTPAINECKIIGSARIHGYENPVKYDYLIPETKQVTITKIVKNNE